jgi:FkbM family methyltransferase
MRPVKFKTRMKWLFRSRSFTFLMDKLAGPDPGTTHEYSWKGTRLLYRPGTSDQALIYEILLRPDRKADYWLPPDIHAKVVLDIGANIGIASTYLSKRFPQAQIYAFEPIPANFSLLKANVESLGNVRPIQAALGATDGAIEMFPSDAETNLGGYSLYEAGSDTTLRLRVDIRRASSMMRDLNLPSADVIKIDTEGSEYAILTDLGKEFLRNVQWIYGELHGNKDFELLAFLSDQFDIGIKRTMGKRLFMFQARKKNPSSGEDGFSS